jgi:alpha-beta hydrolase superfamily lysophospholipase
MSTDPRITSDDSHDYGTAEALYFDSGDQKLFAWLHSPPKESIAGVGVVICKPFGYEAICAHRGMRAFAEAATMIGMPALRFDYLGTGDSADIDRHANQLEMWSRDVVAAVTELQRRTGVERVCLLGFRLGALIATLAAAECKAVCALVLVAPVVSGRRYVRELRTTRLASMLGAESESASGAPPEIQSMQPGSLEVSGFLLSAATLVALSQVDLTELTSPPASEILVIDGDNLPQSRVWVDELSALGATTRYHELPGLVQMLMTAPQFAKIPGEMIAAMCDWLPKLNFTSLAKSAKVFARQVDFGSFPSPNVLVVKDEASPTRALLSEQPIFMGSEARVFGIVAEPQSGEERRRAVILLNAGADYHIGASGMYVGLARRWARRGYVVLRMDLAGLGDSGTRKGRTDEEVFPPDAIDDIRAAVDLLRSRYGVREITLAGLCSGAYHALRAAVAEVPVNRILMINPQNYFWKQGTTLNDVQPAELVRNPRMYRARAFSPTAWKKLITGQVDVGYISKILGNRVLLTLHSIARDIARGLHIRLPGDLGWELERIAVRGVRVVFVFARGEPGIPLLKILAGSSIRHMAARCRVHILDSGDHVFSKSGSRVALDAVLDAELFSRNTGEDVVPSSSDLKRSA